MDRTPQRVKLLDAFMAFLMAVGLLQFVYCVIAGNYVRTMRRDQSVCVQADRVCIAVQCFLVRVLGDGRTVRSYCESEDANEYGE